MIKNIYRKTISEKLRRKIHIFLRKSHSLFLRGNKFYCPTCSQSFKKFLSKGNGIETRENSVCPYCASLERTRLLYLFLKNETKIFNNNPKILHIAPEDALKKHYLNNPNYYDVDINPNYASHKMDITNINFDDNSFDYIICSHVLGHIYNEPLAINELSRVLKSGGVLFALSLIDLNSAQTVESDLNITPQQKLQAYGEPDLLRLHGLDFIDRLKRTNLKIDVIDYRTNFSKEENIKLSLGNGRRELIYKCVKV
ncbi:MAG: class I SAM-dependent methyltransferase [Sphingobacteriales bacterium]|nr:MAG: class I SAM-dependent methyltransferase [Sphingobacteriales bacterium]